MLHVCIVIGRFYEAIAEELLRGAEGRLKAEGATYDIVSVPGAFEIPAAVAAAIASGRYQAYVALGCVIRGETSHYDYVCGESARGLMDLSVRTGAAIGYGILTTETMEQAQARAAVAEGNKGRDTVEAALSIVAVKRNMGVA